MTDLPVAKLRAADGMALYYGTGNRFVGDVDSLTEALEVVQVNANAICDKPKASKKAKARRA